MNMQVILSENLQLFMSDEAHFHLYGTINKHNLHYWAPEQPRLIHKCPLHLSLIHICIRPFPVSLNFWGTTTTTLWVVQPNLVSFFETHTIAINVIQHFHFVTDYFHLLSYQVIHVMQFVF